jgi:hypothetical protein
MNEDGWGAGSCQMSARVRVERLSAFHSPAGIAAEASRGRINWIALAGIAIGAPLTVTSIIIGAWLLTYLIYIV